jgi:hypothetical protein
MSKFGMSLFAGAIALIAMACDDGVVDTADNAAKCQKICNAVDKCTGKDNSTACRKECVDNAENDDFENKVDDCSGCVESGDKCNTNVINCTTECATVVTFSS